MLPVIYQAFCLHQAHHLSRQFLEKEKTPIQKAVSFFVAEFFFYQAYRHFSSSSIVTLPTARLLYGFFSLLPVAKIGAKWAVWYLGWRGTEGRDMERFLTDGLKSSIDLLFVGMKVHALASLVLKREISPLLVFIPNILEQLIQNTGLHHPKTERMIEGFLQAAYNLCLFYPFSIPYYLKEGIEIAFFKKLPGEYVSYLLENYLDGFDACQNHLQGWNDTLTPAYFAVLKEIERLQKGERHPDLGKYPERMERLEDLKAVIDTLPSEALSGLKSDILNNRRGSQIAKQIQALTGVYTGTARDLLDKKERFYPHQQIQADPRTLKRSEELSSGKN